MGHKLLIADDDEDVLSLYSTYLRWVGFDVDAASTFDELEHCIFRKSYDCLVLDLFFGPVQSLHRLSFLLENSPQTSIIMITGRGQISDAVDALNGGASDFLLKSEHPQKIAEKILRTVNRSSNLISESGSGRYGMIGRSKSMTRTFEKIETLGRVDSTVLITGESGTGKELVARGLHTSSSRSGEAFSAVNTGAIPEALLESELFGYRKGAFTDAKKDHKGLFENCSEGTLFLDEIGDMPMRLQVKLLRVLQEKEIVPIGSTTPIKINTRVIAATNKNLAREVQNNRFRSDLFFRLNVINIHLVPLRERREDILPLFFSFITEFCTKYDIAINPVPNSLTRRVELYSWPGNIRELRNSVERAVILSGGEHITSENLFDTVNMECIGESNIHTLADFEICSYNDEKKAFEEQYLRKLLTFSKGSVTDASRISKQYRANLYRMLKKYGIDPYMFK